MGNSEIKSVCILNSGLFWAAWWNLTPSSSILSDIPLASTLPCWSSGRPLVYQDCLPWYLSPCIPGTLILPNTVPNTQQWWCWQYGCTKRTLKMLPLSKKVKVLDLVRTKTHILSLPMVRTNFLSMRLWERKRNSCYFCCHTSNQKLQPQWRIHA